MVKLCNVFNKPKDIITVSIFALFSKFIMGSLSLCYTMCFRGCACDIDPQ